jgi:hypothetical protein
MSHSARSALVLQGGGAWLRGSFASNYRTRLLLSQ